MLLVKFSIVVERCDEMTFNQALEMAVQYYNNLNCTSVTRALDAQTHWIFYGGRKDEIEIGGTGIKINKKDGQIEDFILPDDENFELLGKSNKIDL